ncbi:MAG TPA: tetratricopeptide repeat protein [Terriglobales bacterium]|nr:tetratricopeptide repeat protein [Terriglobales bacterium]
MFRKIIGPFAAVILTAALIACSSMNRQLLQAHDLQKRGDYKGALALYNSVLPNIPVSQSRTAAAVLLEMGECYFQQERYSEAFSAYQKASELDAGNLLAHLRLGELFLGAGAIDRAREQAQIVLHNAAGSNDALALLAGVWAASGQNDLAENAYRRVLNNDPKRVQVAVALADLLNRENKVDAARQVLRASAQAQPHSSLPLLALGRLEEEAGNTGGAEVAYRRAVQAEDTPETNLRLAQYLERTARVPEAEQVLRHIDAQRSTLPTSLADFEMISGRTQDAQQGYAARLGQLSSLQPAKAHDRQISHEIKAEQARLVTRLIEADLEMAGQKTGQDRQTIVRRAQAEVERYQKDLDGATTAVLQAEIALAASDVPGAQAAAEKALSTAPESPAAHYVLGEARYRAGDPAGARTEWVTALENNPHFTPARLALAHYSLRVADLKGAEDYIVAVVRDEPANLGALDVFARVLLEQGRLQSAGLIARRALAIGGSSPEPHLVLGEIELQQGKLAGALIEFEQAVLLEPRSEQAVEDLTRVYQQGAITRPMLARMERVALAEPPSATLMEIAGRLYQQRGWFSDAKRCLSRALEIDPQRETAAAALAQTFAATGQLSAAADSAARGGAKSAPLLAAIRAEDQHNVSSAIQNYEDAVRQGDHSGVAANNLAWLYATHGQQLDRAMTLAETARQQAPDNPAVLDTVGVVHLSRREYSQAIKALETARRLASLHKSATAPQVVQEIRRHLSEAYLRAGQPAAAALVARLRE